MIPARVFDVLHTTPRTRQLRLELERPFAFRAGQAVFAGLAGTDTRAAYSIASPPSLGRQARLDLLVTADGVFGVVGLAPEDVRGRTVEIDGPIGYFGVPDAGADAPLLLVAGGTGIAPLRSVILDRLERDAPGPMTLVYSARTPDEFACGDELLALAERGHLSVHLTVTREEAPAATQARTGRVNDALLRAALPAPDAWCLVCGPAGFVQASAESLTAIGVAAERIVIER
ncbi:MAG: oxidoreductase [Vicinamibacterales bacterium]